MPGAVRNSESKVTNKKSGRRTPACRHRVPIHSDPGEIKQDGDRYKIQSSGDRVDKTIQLVSIADMKIFAAGEKFG